MKLIVLARKVWAFLPLVTSVRPHSEISAESAHVAQAVSLGGHGEVDVITDGNSRISLGGLIDLTSSDTLAENGTSANLAEGRQLAFAVDAQKIGDASVSQHREALKEGEAEEQEGDKELCKSFCKPTIGDADVCEDYPPMGWSKGDKGFADINAIKTFCHNSCEPGDGGCEGKPSKPEKQEEDASEGNTPTPDASEGAEDQDEEPTATPQPDELDKLGKSHVEGATDTPSGYRHMPKACISGYNIRKYPDKTVEECAVLCDDEPQCRGFEYGVAHGGAGHYQAHDCQLNRDDDTIRCDGAHHNLDWYAKVQDEEENTPTQKVDDGDGAATTDKDAHGEEDENGQCKDVCMPNEEDMGACKHKNAAWNYHDKGFDSKDDMTKFCLERCHPQGAECGSTATKPEKQEDWVDGAEEGDNTPTPKSEEGEAEEQEGDKELCKSFCKPTIGDADVCEDYPPMGWSKGDKGFAEEKDIKTFCHNSCEPGDGGCEGKASEPKKQEGAKSPEKVPDEDGTITARVLKAQLGTGSEDDSGDPFAETSRHTPEIEEATKKLGETVKAVSEQAVVTASDLDAYHKALDTVVPAMEDLGHKPFEMETAEMTQMEGLEESRLKMFEEGEKSGNVSSSPKKQSSDSGDQDLEKNLIKEGKVPLDNPSQMPEPNAKNGEDTL